MMVVQITMNNVLSYYGAKSIYGGNIPLAVSGIIAKINMLIMAFIIGSGQGSQPILGFNYGAKNYDRVIETYKLTVTITSIIAFISFLIFQIFPRQVVAVFGDGSELYFHFAERYMRIYSKRSSARIGNFLYFYRKRNQRSFHSDDKAVNIFTSAYYRSSEIFWN